MSGPSARGVGMDDARLRRLRRLSVVPRWVTIPTIREQNVDSHSFHVMWIAVWLAGRIGLAPHHLESLLIYCLLHDEPEAVSGDIPSPAKTVIGEALRTFELGRGYAVPMTFEVKYVAKMADCLEALMFCFEEQELGNKSLDSIVEDISDKLRKARSTLLEMGTYPLLEEATHWDLEQELWEIVHPQRHPVLDEIAHRNVVMGDIPF